VDRRIKDKKEVLARRLAAVWRTLHWNEDKVGDIQARTRMSAPARPRCHYTKLRLEGKMCKRKGGVDGEKGIESSDRIAICSSNCVWFYFFKEEKKCYPSFLAVIC
jgi:hypothetical protein